MYVSRLGRLALLGLLAASTFACNLGDDAPPEQAVCGDGLEQSPEACDDGNTDDGDYCASNCAAVTGSCGDSITQNNEACDDGNTDDGDGCSSDCTAVCGDGEVGTGEVCDDGNTDDGDYCSADCMTSFGACGDDAVQSFEACDDGNTDDGDYCASDCQSVTGTCGDDTTQDNEVCDDGNAEDGDYCSADCLTITGRCGDDTVQSNEACDDGDTEDGDYCSADCETSFGACGDDVVQDFEVCDDGNTDDGDYCASDCQNVTGACGDDTIQPNEACDDGNTNDGDYCAGDCTGVTGRCGDGALQFGEECDDGDDDDADSCSNACVVTPITLSGSVTIDAPTTWTAGSRITVAQDAEILVTSDLVIAEGVQITFEQGSRMEVRAGTLDIRGTANYAVSFEYDPTSTGECGDWEGVLVNRGTFTATHALFSKTTRGVRVYNSDATVSDVRIEKVCAPAANAAEPGLPIAGLHVAGGESDIRRVVVEDVRAAPSASVFGQPGYDAAGIWIQGSRTSALEDITITTIRATSGQDGLLAGGPDGLSGTLGGDGGDARGIHLDDMANADVDLDITRVVVSDVIGGAGGAGGDAREGRDGRDRSSRPGDPGDAGGSGGDGGRSGDAVGIDVQLAGIVRVSNVLVTGVRNSSSGSGGTGGDGGEGGDGGGTVGIPPIIYDGGRGGDAGAGGDAGVPGTTAGVRASASSVTIEHVTIHDLSNEGAGIAGNAGRPGVGGRAGGAGSRANSGSSAADGKRPPAESLPACVQIGAFAGVLMVDSIVRFSVFSFSSSLYGIAVLDGTGVNNGFNLYDQLLDTHSGTSLGATEIEAQPLFTNATGGDYTPQEASPLRDAADASTLLVDVYSNPRDAAPDIGAIEYTP